MNTQSSNTWDIYDTDHFGPEKSALVRAMRLRVIPAERDAMIEDVPVDVAVGSVAIELLPDGAGPDTETIAHTQWLREHASGVVLLRYDDDECFYHSLDQIVGLIDVEFRRRARSRRALVIRCHREKFFRLRRWLLTRQIHRWRVSSREPIERFYVTAWEWVI